MQFSTVHIVPGYRPVLLCEIIVKACMIAACYFFYFLPLYKQWNPVNTDTKGTRQNFRIIGVSVLSGFPDKKSRTHVLLMKRPWQAICTVTKRFNCAVTSFFCNCNRLRPNSLWRNNDITAMLRKCQKKKTHNDGLCRQCGQHNITTCIT